MGYDKIVDMFYNFNVMADITVEDLADLAVRYAVIRCKECKHRRVSEEGLFKSGYFCERCHIDSDMENCDDWYCADGERREEND